jgi:hypothetical protein
VLLTLFVNNRHFYNPANAGSPNQSSHPQLAVFLRQYVAVCQTGDFIISFWAKLEPYALLSPTPSCAIGAYMDQGFQGYNPLMNMDGKWHKYTTGVISVNDPSTLTGYLYINNNGCYGQDIYFDDILLYPA